MVPGRLEGGLEQVKVDGRHLGAEDCVIFTHFLGKYHTFVAGRLYLAANFLFLPDPEGGEEGTDADAGGAQIVYLVNFQAGVNLP